jgi:pyruvate dehydrogenase E2 component (dihydrolipoamide acetyltransferase)
LARERGVELSGIAGSGPDGVVLATDVGVAAGVAGKTAAPLGTPASPLGTVWRLMAERTTSAWTTVPHFFVLREVNAGRLAAWRESCQRRFNIEVTYSDLLVKLVAAALRKHPRLNARWEGDAVINNDEINIGLAVASADGLIVPVIHAADRLGVSEITRHRTDLVGRARAGKARPEDLRGGTFTISNLGMYGVDAFTAILNAPQAATLAVGRIAERVVPVEGKPVIQPMVMLSLSCDHRVADGARAAQFLETLAELIEKPASLVE